MSDEWGCEVHDADQGDLVGCEPCRESHAEHITDFFRVHRNSPEFVVSSREVYLAEHDPVISVGVSVPVWEVRHDGVLIMSGDGLRSDSAREGVAVVLATLGADMGAGYGPRVSAWVARFAGELEYMAAECSLS